MTLRFSFEYPTANQKCRRCGAAFTPGPEDPLLMDMCPECHYRKIRRANSLLLDRLAAITPCRLCGHCEKVHRYKCTRFLDVCTTPGCGCQNFVARHLSEYEPWVDGVFLKRSTSLEEMDGVIAAMRKRFPDFQSQEPRIASLLDQFRQGFQSNLTVENYLEGLYLVAKFASFSSCASEAGANQVITNKDVVAMVGAGVDDQTVIAKIKTSPIRFALSAGELIKLKKSRVSDAIIETMLKTQDCGSR